MMTSKKVITPVKTGVQTFCKYSTTWIPAFAGMTEKGLFGLFASASTMRGGKP
jgi:hypothetical protein